MDTTDSIRASNFRTQVPTNETQYGPPRPAQQYQQFQQKPEPYNVAQSNMSGPIFPNPSINQSGPPKPTYQPPQIRPEVEPSPQMNYRPPQTNQFEPQRTSQEYTFSQPSQRSEPKPQYNQTNPQQTTQPQINQSYQTQPQFRVAADPYTQTTSQQQPPPVTQPQMPIPQTRPQNIFMPNKTPIRTPAENEDDVISGHMSSPPITSSLQLAGYQNGTQNARTAQNTRPSLKNRPESGRSERSLSSSPEPKFRSSSPESVSSPTVRQAPFERLPSFDKQYQQQPQQKPVQQQQHQPAPPPQPKQQPNQQQRVVQFAQPPAKPRSAQSLGQSSDKSNEPGIRRVFSPEPNMQNISGYQRAKPPDTIDLSQVKTVDYSPVSLNNLITPTHKVQSPGVKFQLPPETEFKQDTRKEENAKKRQEFKQATPTSESFRRTPMATTPENIPRASNPWFNRPRSAERRYKGDNDSGVDESTQEKQERNGYAKSPGSPTKSKIPGLNRTPNRSRSTSKQRLSVQTPESPNEPLIKKVPMNKIQVGAAPSPNLKQVKSKIGSLDNATHRPGGGNVKIETKKIEIKAAPRIDAKNQAYAPKGGEKKIISQKLQWNAKSKIGSLENKDHQPKGGDVKPLSASAGRLNPDGSIVSQKVDIKAQSKIGSLDNIKHKPGGGDKKIFDDKEYLKNVEHPIQPTPPSQSPLPTSLTTSVTADENLNQQS